MLAELVRHVVGVDPDRDWITVAVVQVSTSAVVAEGRFSADDAGYHAAVGFVDGHSELARRAWAIEGTASYGRGLAAMLGAGGERVVEFDRPTRKTKDGAKSDALDAARAARELVGRPSWNTPRRHDGVREAIRVHAVTRSGAVRARTAAINELKAMIVTAQDELRAQLRQLTTSAQVARCQRLRDRSSDTIAASGTRRAMRALARRIAHLDTEIADHDRALKALLNDAAPQLIAEVGIGYTVAAEIYMAWSHPGRCRSESAFARLAGVAPIEATSGQNQTRHRLNRGGARRLNQALYLVAITRRRCHQPTQAYIARRLAQGTTQREAIRCIKRYIARHVWRLLEHSPITT